MVPEDIKGSLERYVKNRVPTGGFLYAVLCNDLMEACARADTSNRIRLFDICSYIYNELPMACHGCPENVKNWLKENGINIFSKKLLTSESKYDKKDNNFKKEFVMKNYQKILIGCIAVVGIFMGGCAYQGTPAERQAQAAEDRNTMDGILLLDILGAFQ